MSVSQLFKKQFRGNLHLFLTLSFSAFHVALATDDVPAFVTASVNSAREIVVDWNLVTGAAYYDIAFSEDGRNYTSLKTGIKTNSYLHKPANPGSTFYYRVRSCLKNGSCSEYSINKSRVLDTTERKREGNISVAVGPKGKLWLLYTNGIYFAEEDASDFRKLSLFRPDGTPRTFSGDYAGDSGEISVTPSGTIYVLHPVNGLNVINERGIVQPFVPKGSGQRKFIDLNKSGLEHIVAGNNRIYIVSSRLNLLSVFSEDGTLVRTTDLSRMGKYLKYRPWIDEGGVLHLLYSTTPPKVVFGEGLFDQNGSSLNSRTDVTIEEIRETWLTARNQVGDKLKYTTSDGFISVDGRTRVAIPITPTTCKRTTPGDPIYWGFTPNGNLVQVRREYNLRSPSVPTQDNYLHTRDTIWVERSGKSILHRLEIKKADGTLFPIFKNNTKWGDEPDNLENWNTPSIDSLGQLRYTGKYTEQDETNLVINLDTGIVNYVPPLVCKMPSAPASIRNGVFGTYIGRTPDNEQYSLTKEQVLCIHSNSGQILKSISFSVPFVRGVEYQPKLMGRQYFPMATDTEGHLLIPATWTDEQKTSRYPSLEEEYQVMVLERDGTYVNTIKGERAIKYFSNYGFRNQKYFPEDENLKFADLGGGAYAVSFDATFLSCFFIEGKRYCYNYSSDGKDEKLPLGKIAFNRNNDLELSCEDDYSRIPSNGSPIIFHLARSQVSNGKDFDNQGNRYTIARESVNNGRIAINSPSGKVINSFKIKFFGLLPFTKIAVSTQGNVCVPQSPTENQVAVYDPKGKLLYALGSGLGITDGKLAAPSACAFDSTGQVFIASTSSDQVNSGIFYVPVKSHRISVFDVSGKFKRSFGSMGSDFGQFYNITDIAVSNDGTVAVVDSGNNRIYLGVPATVSTPGF